MELIGSLLLIFSVLLIVAIFVTQPFFRRGKWFIDGSITGQQEHDHQRSTLLAERDRVLTALHELDFDYALGKVPQEDYPEQRAVLLHSGADILRRLDELNSTSGALDGDSSTDIASHKETVEDRIEAAVAARRADTGRSVRPAVSLADRPAGNGSVAVKDDLEELIASRKRQRKESSAGFCPNCGKPVQKSDRFCSKCGADL